MNEPKFLAMLERMWPYRSTCLFIVVPDVLGDAGATLANFNSWAARLTGWPLAFVAQDGQEHLKFPSEGWETLFVGGSTAWKKSMEAIACIKRAQALGKRIHIGRVNYCTRYRLFAQITGSEAFTCDGTRPRYDRESYVADWLRLQKERSLPLW